MQMCTDCPDKQEAEDSLCYSGAALSELDATNVAAGALDGWHHGHDLPQESLMVCKSWKCMHDLWMNLQCKPCTVEAD